MHLYMIYLGGKHTNSLIELHDVRFVAGNTIEETYPLLRESWWGVPDSLHLDAWGIVRQVDGYDIHLKDFPSQGREQLYFANLGGYDPLEFTELHKNICIVAENDLEAKKKARDKITDWKLPHKDYIHAVEGVWQIQTMLAAQNQFIHLELAKKTLPFEFTSNYVPIAV
ncbi:MAG TPA: DUF1543 domain-containing protein [Gammaproteobacteria bacterium]|nr:DUF1543 domain-containing protein [Gammaproteobacteria bacterium]